MSEEYYERHFKETYIRNPEGRFVIKLPMRENVLKGIGNSRGIAMKRVLSLEKRLARNPDLKTEYMKFSNKYENLEHMKAMLVSTAMLYLWNKALKIFLHYQAVIKEYSKPTKVRVVFDASSKNSKGISLNDALQ